jgi:hypothetical protein
MISRPLKQSTRLRGNVKKKCFIGILKMLNYLKLTWKSTTYIRSAYNGRAAPTWTPRRGIPTPVPHFKERRQEMRLAFDADTSDSDTI